MNHLDLGSLIKKLRLEKGLSQAQLGQKIGRSDSVVSQYETNSRTPSPEVLIKLSELFRIPLDNLVGNVPKEAIIVHGLTESQKQLLKLEIEEFMDQRINPNVKGLTKRQQEIINALMDEFAKKRI